MIFDIIFGKSYGKVHCPFHEGDSTASLSIAADGRWHCFACGAGGPHEVSFAQQYYGIAKTSATRLIEKLNSLPKYKYQEELDPEDIKYLTSIGISLDVQKKMMRSSAGKLLYPHNYLGVEIDHTWFNYPGSTAHNPKYGKYSRDFGSVSGFLTPYKLALKDTVIIVEGEKDMLTMLSNGIPATTIVGGANTLPYMMQRELKGKNVVIIYDCDDPGREGAAALVHWLYSIEVKSVKNVDLGLGEKEDINDWFVKYTMGREALIKLINATPNAEVTTTGSMKVFKMYRQITKQLSPEEQEELKALLNKEGTEDAE